MKSSVAVPVFVTVITWAALLVPTFWLPKLKLVGDRVTLGWAARNTGKAKTAKKANNRLGVPLDVRCISR